MIRSFESAALKRYWNTGKAKGLPAQDIKKIERILTSLGAASAPADMALPQYRFHPLKGDRKGTYSVTVRANWRITFEWEEGAAVRVDLEDYHGD
jgi:proteic killer suppression protein